MSAGTQAWEARQDSRHGPLAPLGAEVSRRLSGSPGQLVCVLAAAGYGKTYALRHSSPGEGIWCDLTPLDREPARLAATILEAAGELPLPHRLGRDIEAIAAAVADRLSGRRAVVTLDMLRHLSRASEAWAFLTELIALLPQLTLRVGTRVRPALPLERMQLDSRLVDIGPHELRLAPHQIETLLARTWGSPASPDAIEYADAVLYGWPAAVLLWASSPAVHEDLQAPLGCTQLLHEYLHHEVLGTLAEDAQAILRRRGAELLDMETLQPDQADMEMRRLIEQMIRDRIGVLGESGGWRLHPLMRRFLEMHRPYWNGEAPGGAHSRAEATPPADAAAVERLHIRALGRFELRLGPRLQAGSDWRSLAACRLLCALLAAPGHQLTAEEGARLLWPRHRRDAALNSFTVAVHRLRAELQPEWARAPKQTYVVRTGRAYGLSPSAVWSDVGEFTARLARAGETAGPAGIVLLEEALDAYHGDLLPGIDDDFVVRRRNELRLAHHAAVAAVVQYHFTSGRIERALRLLESLLDREPRRTDIWALALEGCLRTDDTLRAIRLLHRCDATFAAAGEPAVPLIESLRRRVRTALSATSDEPPPPASQPASGFSPAR